MKLKPLWRLMPNKSYVQSLRKGYTHEKIYAEFKEFIMRGNVLDLAVGVIIGGAFQKSLVLW